MCVILPSIAIKPFDVPAHSYVNRLFFFFFLLRAPARKTEKYTEEEECGAIGLEIKHMRAWKLKILFSKAV